MGKTFAEKEYEVHYYETDYSGKLGFSNFINYFNDIAVQHSCNCGMDLEYLAQREIAWVLYKLDLKIKSCPSFLDKIKVKTWAHAFNKFYGYRKFEVTDSNENIIATADSIWILINTVKRKPARISNELLEKFSPDKTADEVLKIENIRELKEIDNSLEFKVRYSDIDTNRHVNSAKYAGWLIEAVPLEIVLNYRLEEINITYKKETMYGETIKSAVNLIKEKDKIICIHKIVSSDGVELNAAQTVWVKN